MAEERELILKLGQKITDRIGHKVTVEDPEYYGLACVVTDEMAEIALKMKVRKPMTLDQVAKATGKSKKYLEPLLQEMSSIGLLEYNWENPSRTKQYVLPMFVPGSAEFFNMKKDQIDAHPEELSKLVRQFNKQKVFTLDGPEYARSKGQTSDLLRPWYQKRSLSLRWEGPLDERIFTSALAEDIIAGFKTLIPFYHYFNKLVALTPRQERRGEEA